MDSRLQKMVDADFKRFEKKLEGYEFVSLSQLKAGDAVRYVKREYKSDNFKCVFCFIDNCEEMQPVKVRGYVPRGSPDAPMTWSLSLKSLPYIRFYRKVEQKKTT